jgi:hypothetical protein
MKKYFDFLRSITINCVDLRKVNAMLDLTHSIELESEFRNNFIIDLTSRYNNFKKTFAKAAFSHKKEDIAYLADENMSAAASYLNKMQEDRFFGLVCKYVG